jgi:hypothetical protein
VGVDAIDPGEVDARDAMEVLASIEAGIGPSGLPLAMMRANETTRLTWLATAPI